MPKGLCRWAGLAELVLVAVLAGVTTGALAQRAEPVETRSVLVRLVGTDSVAGTVSFSARAALAALRLAESSRPGQTVLIRWATTGEQLGSRVSSVLPVTTTAPPKVARGRGHFAMRAVLDGTQRPQRVIGFTIPVDETARAVVESHGPGRWLRLTVALDSSGVIQAITQVEAP